MIWTDNGIESSAKKEFDLAVYIGRFQPFHNGHYETIKKAQEIASRVLILIGSANQPRTIKNPFSYDERSQLIYSIFDNIECCAIEDNLYDDNAWAAQVVNNVSQYPDCYKQRVCIIGHNKDESSFYLKMFPQWKQVEMDNIGSIDGTKIREQYFLQPTEAGALSPLPKESRKFLFDFSRTEEYKKLQKEFIFIKSYKAAWSVAPYPPTFVTVDAVLFYCGHVLMVKRKAEPGKGLWALPGGFIGANEKIEDACIRELYEETKLGLYPSEVLSMKRAQQVFDHPQRSLRGRTITHAFNFSTILPIPRLEGKLPYVKGADDAEKAKWIPIGEVVQMGDQIFEDHLSVIKFFL